MSPCLLILGLTAGCGTPPTPPPVQVPATVEDRWLAEDKLQHFAMSFAVTGMAYGAGRAVLEPDPARSAALGLALVLGLGKELADVRRGDGFSLKDLAWDAAGVALGIIFVQRID